VSSSVPYHATKRALQLSQWTSSVRSRLGVRENSSPVCESDSFRRGIWYAKDISLGPYRLFT
jgi:hypothetical protein